MNTLVSSLFAVDCITEEDVPGLVDDQLFAEERQHIAKAVDKRRAEFGTARVVARRALARLGIPPQPLVPQPDRAPRWPAGVIGSITHTAGYCAVVVTSERHARSVGLDVEQDKTLAPGLIDMICTPSERASLGTRAERDAIVFFSAKEAFYKCQYPLTKTFLDFRDVELTVDFEARTWQARVLKALADKPAWLDGLAGSFVRERGLVASGATLPP